MRWEETVGRAEGYFETVKVQDSCSPDIHVRYGVLSTHTHTHTHTHTCTHTYTHIYILSHCVLNLIKIQMIFKAVGFNELTDNIKWSDGDFGNQEMKEEERPIEGK